MKYENNELIKRAIPAIATLPEAAITLFRVVSNKQIEKGQSPGLAHMVAWGVVKGRFVQKDGVWVARTESFQQPEYYSFKTEPAESFITRTESGLELHNYVLSDVLPDSFGTSPTEDLLKEWASWINENQPEADVDHQLYNDAIKTHGADPERVKKMVRSKKGIAKAVKAMVDNGRLLVSLAFDKRYSNYVPKIKGLSIEAAAVRDTLTNKFKKGELLGFTLAMNDRPSNPRSIRLG